MEITVSEQKVFLLTSALSPEQAREKARDHKMVAFGSFSRLLPPPRATRSRWPGIAVRLGIMLQEAVVTFGVFGTPQVLP
jgi:hypothetical protein